MRGRGLLPFIVLIGAGVVGHSKAWAEGPMVIPGMGPAISSDPAYRPAPARVAAAGPRYGGGFLELLVTGRDPTDNYQPAPTRAVIPAPAARVAPQSRSAYYTPPEPTSGPSRAIEPRFLRQEVDYQTNEPPGSLVVNTPERYLYLVLGHGRALRYGIGVGRPGFAWAGVKTVSRKAEWPGWTPPPEMLLRRPDLPRHMDGGPENPLGARAMYLGSSLYRIHGTNEPWTIGQNVSSGCIRMMNEDVIDLYERVKVGTKVLII